MGPLQPSVSFPDFIKLFPFEVYCSMLTTIFSGAGPFGPVQDVFRASLGLFRSSGVRTITRKVVGAPLAFLINFKKVSKFFKKLKKALLEKY